MLLNCYNYNPRICDYIVAGFFIAFLAVFLLLVLLLPFSIDLSGDFRRSHVVACEAITGVLLAGLLPLS